MKIYHIIIGLNIGGAESMLKKLIQSQLKNPNYKHSIVSLTKIGSIGIELQEQGVKVQALGMKNVFSLFPTLINLTRILKSEKPDIVQTWMYHADLIGGLAAKIAGIKCILWGIRATKINIGNNRSTLYVQKLCAILSRYVPSKIICVAEASKKSHVLIGYDERKMLVINNGFDIEHFSSSGKSKKQIRKELDVHDRFVVGSVGRLNLDKNHYLLLSVAEKIVKKIPNATFLLVGRGVDDANSEFYKTIEKKKLLNHFRLIGEVEDIVKYYQSMDVFCLHSDTEGFPNVLGEAMASGLPCVATDAGDAKVLLDDDSMVVDCGDADGIAERIVMLEQLPMAERERIGNANTEKIKKNYSIDQISKKFEKLYEQSMELDK